mgnify:CR=1 FL=1
MKVCYPVILEKCEDGSGYLVTIPDFDNNTFGETIPEAIEMARDAINLLCVSYEDHNDKLPAPSDFEALSCKANEVKALVDADPDAYRRMLDNRDVKL